MDERNVDTYGQNITAGYSDGTFHPADTVTRMAMAAFLQRDALETAWTPPATPSFSDVPVGAPFYASIEWMRYAAITNGFADGSYHPADPVTRQAMAAFLHRLATHLAG